jgi:DNA-directed RNA polymerase specialized sigma24 family protein
VDRSSLPDHSDAITIGTFFADQLCRMRGLTAEESDLLARLLARCPSDRPLRRWTGTQDAELLTLLAQGLTAAEIGLAVGRTTDAVHTRVKRLKIKETADDARR